MSNKKEMVAIDKEQWNYIVDKLTKDVPDSNKEAFLKAVNPIEIQIDQSKEEIYLKHVGKGVNIKTVYYDRTMNAMEEYATSQQIIEQLRVKEKEEKVGRRCHYCGEPCVECGHKE